LKKRKSIATIALTALLSLNMSVPAFADDTTAYTVEYSKVEQMVLGCNLQVNSNNFLLKSLDNESEMKEKYSQLSDMISKTSSSLTATGFGRIKDCCAGYECCTLNPFCFSGHTGRYFG
jgi:hypothetical protein